MAGTSVLFVGNQNMVTVNYTARQRIKKIVSFLFSQLLFNSLKNHSYSAKNGIDLEIIFLHFNGIFTALICGFTELSFLSLFLLFGGSKRVSDRNAVLAFEHGSVH